jgi:hypothetical protein
VAFICVLYTLLCTRKAHDQYITVHIKFT